MKLKTLCAILVSAAVALGLISYLRRGRTPVRPEPTHREVVPIETPVRVPEIRNVVLISMDTTRWDAISSYGAPEVNSPHIGAFGRENVIFENAFSPMPVTLPSHASMLTGKIPPAHGVFDNGRYTLAEEHVTLAEVLKEHGFNTAAFVSALVMDSKFGLDQGFGIYDDAIEESALIGERRGDVTISRAIDWLGKHDHEKNFIFIHLFDPHAPYEAPEPFASEITKIYHDDPEFVRAYVAEIAFTDHCIGLFIDNLKELGIYDNSLICITADHGESQTEHGENTHGYFIYTSTTKVPLIFKVPGAKAPSRVAEPVGIVDIYPTVLSLLGIRVVEEIQGRNLAGYFQGKTHLYPERGVFSMSLEPRKYGGNSLLGLVVDGFQYIQTTRPELYDLTRDVYETTDLIDRDPQRAHTIKQQLKAILDEASSSAAQGQRISVDGYTVRRLESLGYVMTDGADDDLDSESTAIDPKDLIGYHIDTQIALSHVNPENIPLALAACEDMIATRPDFYLGYLLMGRVLAAAGREQDALPYLDKARSMSPKSPD
jgi:choline-sulfatase